MRGLEFSSTSWSAPSYWRRSFSCGRRSARSLSPCRATQRLAVRCARLFGSSLHKDSRHLLVLRLLGTGDDLGDRLVAGLRLFGNDLRCQFCGVVRKTGHSDADRLLLAVPELRSLVVGHDGRYGEVDLLGVHLERLLEPGASVSFFRFGVLEVRRQA